MVVSLRGGLQLTSSSLLPTLKPCSCKKKCGKRCGCVKARRPCFARCHGSKKLDCGNTASGEGGDEEVENTPNEGAGTSITEGDTEVGGPILRAASG